MKLRKLALWSSAAGLLLLAWVAPGQQPRRIDDAALRNAGKTGEEWLSYGLTPGETRYSPLNQINTTNASRLGLNWLYEIGPGGGNQEGTLLMSNGTLYGITNWSIVYAVDARTGKEKWRWDPEVNRTAVQPKICCGVVNRGVAIYEGNIIAPVIDGRLIALNMETGKPVWETRVSYTQDSYTLTMAPRIAKGKVIIGVAGAEYPVRGFFEAHDAKTGQFAWRTYTVPGDPSKPPENEDMRRAAATWSTEGMKMGGGGSVWDGMAYDPEADLFYVGTGNAGPWTQDSRQQGKDKENLYAASILAVKPDTGKLAWYFQMVPGDEWDFDSVQQLLLADVVIKGQPRKVIMQANKNGFYYVIDRVTGKFISGQPFAQVTWARGLNEETGKPIINNESYYHSSPFRSLRVLEARTTGRRCRSIRPPAWCTCRRRPAAASTILPIPISNIGQAARIWVLRSADSAGAVRPRQAMLRMRPERLPRLLPSLCPLLRRSDRNRPKVAGAEASCSHGTWWLRRNAGAHKAAAESAAAR